MAINITLWGITLALQAAMFNFQGIIALRAFLGVFEAATQPTFTLLSGMWYTREEQAGAVTFWYVAFVLYRVCAILITEQVHDERCKPDCWWFPRFLLLSCSSYRSNQVLAGSLHYLWYHNRLLGSLCWLVDA